jgi:hypothetical protein
MRVLLVCFRDSLLKPVVVHEQPCDDDCHTKESCDYLKLRTTSIARSNILVNAISTANIV